MALIGRVLRTVLMLTAAAGAVIGVVAYRQRQTRRMGIVDRVRERLTTLGRREPTFMDRVSDLSKRGYHGMRRGTGSVRGVASQQWTETVLPMAREGSVLAKSKAIEFGGRAREALSEAMPGEIPSIGRMTRVSGIDIETANGADKGAEVRIRGIRMGASRAAKTAGSTVQSSVRTLTRLALLIAGLGAVLIYIYAPEREKQIKFWEDAKQGSRQVGRTFHDIREFVSDLRTEAS